MTDITNKRALGTSYEQYAADYLRQKGYQILAHNFRCRLGEIDLITKKENMICFVEVKYRSSDRCGDPTEAVDWQKQKRISNAASYYLYHYHLPTDTPCRFDVVAVSPDGIRLIENAFDYAGHFR